MINFLKILVTVLLMTLVGSFQSHSQSNKPEKRKKEKTQQTKEKSNKAEKRAAYNKGVDKHSGIQDKKTKKRMKKTRKKSMIHAGKKKVPFYKRWFRRN